jgi:hypothetical protein
MAAGPNMGPAAEPGEKLALDKVSILLKYQHG